MSETDETEKIAGEIESVAIGPVGIDRDTGGSTMVSRDLLLEWTERIRSIDTENGQGDSQ